MIVKVEVLVGLVTEAGLNEALAPEGNDVVILKVAVQAVPLPLKFALTPYVAELPAVTGLGFCAPTPTD